MALVPDNVLRGELLFDREPSDRDIEVALLLKGALDCLECIKRVIAKYDDFAKQLIEK